jgi:hypothetical protein
VRAVVLSTAALQNCFPTRVTIQIRFATSALTRSATSPRLGDVLGAAGNERLRLSETFDDGVKLLEAAGQMRLEGIVSKKRSAPYVGGAGCGWIKVKTREWREANRERYKLFERA